MVYPDHVRHAILSLLHKESTAIVLMVSFSASTVHRNGTAAGRPRHGAWPVAYAF